MENHQYLPSRVLIKIFQSLTSFPIGNPLPNEEHSPTILDTSVRNVRYSFNTTPRKTVFISGIPEPISEGKRVIIQYKTIVCLYCSKTCSKCIPNSYQLHLVQLCGQIRLRSK